MKENSGNNTSKVTKVLIDKIHGGRKQDSKFWQSEFSQRKKQSTKKENRNDLPTNRGI
jgi:hypothetical protein